MCRLKILMPLLCLSFCCTAQQHIGAGNCSLYQDHIPALRPVPTGHFYHTPDSSAIRIQRFSITNYGNAPMPFFCRQEARLEQQLKFPVRIRLGSPEYTNWLEQKSSLGVWHAGTGY